MWDKNINKPDRKTCAFSSINFHNLQVIFRLENYEQCCKAKRSCGIEFPRLIFTSNTITSFGYIQVCYWKGFKLLVKNFSNGKTIRIYCKTGRLKWNNKFGLFFHLVYRLCWGNRFWATYNKLVNEIGNPPWCN